jgi:N-acetylmuramoyl-L-alanine amidase
MSNSSRNDPHAAVHSTFPHECETIWRYRDKLPHRRRWKCEGRGFRYVGSHTTRGFNRKSIAITFVGNFMETLPSQESIDLCQKLILGGVKGCFIAPHYKLVGHCQCKATESPGRMLFNELKTWPHHSKLPWFNFDNPRFDCLFIYSLFISRCTWCM